MTTFTHHGGYTHTPEADAALAPDDAALVTAWLDDNIENWRDLCIVSLTVREGPPFEYVCCPEWREWAKTWHGLNPEWPEDETRTGTARTPFPLHAVLRP